MNTTTPHPKLCELLREDLRVHDAKKINMFNILAYLRRPGYSAVFLYRLSAACLPKGILGSLASRLLARLNMWINSCDIYPEAVIGPGFIVGHPLGVVIGRVVIGRQARIQQNVTLGLRRFTDADIPSNYPTLGDNVSVSAGAVILGNVKIGDGALIGANAVVIDNVPENAIAVGVPARVIDKPRKPVA